MMNIEHYDKTCLENVLQAVNNILLSNWGTQNYSQILVFTDCGIGIGSTSLNATIKNLEAFNSKSKLHTNLSGEQEIQKWIPYKYPSKLSFLCLGNMSDSTFKESIKVYQKFLNVSGQKGELFLPNNGELNDEQKAASNDNDSGNNSLTRHTVDDIVEKMCEVNYKQFEAILKCGNYFKLESPILIWPSPLPHSSVDAYGTEITRSITKKIEICGYLSLADIGSPMAISRHLILPKIDNNDKTFNKTEKKNLKTMKNGENDLEKLVSDIKMFYSKTEGDDEDNQASNNQGDTMKESICVLLHGALKVENMAALVLLSDNWFGFIYSYADSKKKSNLMLTILPPGHDIIPWLGDLRYLGTISDAFPGETPSFPVKPEKRSYSQNCVVWIKQAGLQSDIQKVLRHAKKLPEKTQNFYKELNRIRRAALSLGFVELLDGLAYIFENEISPMPENINPDCVHQLKHVIAELRKTTNRDLKNTISALPTKFNQ